MPLIKRTVTVGQVERSLVRRSYPRTILAGIVSLATIAGFLTSVGLVHAGVASMAIRYVAATLVGYGALLVSLRMWIHFQNPAEHLDTPPLESDRFDSSARGSGLGVSDDVAAGISALGDVGEFPVVLVLVVIGISLFLGLIGTALVIADAPTFLAELVLDGVIAGSAYRHLRDASRSGWLRGAIRRTALPMLGLLVSLMIFGWLAQTAVPGLVTIGELLRPRVSSFPN